MTILDERESVAFGWKLREQRRTGAGWLVHAWWSWRRPDRFGPFGVLLLAGLPLAAVATTTAFGSTPERELSQHEALPRGEYGDLRVRLLILAAELVMAWFVALALEGVLVAIRASRRHRLDTPHLNRAEDPQESA